jgi:uncharacterized protein (TIGR01619 family)
MMNLAKLISALLLLTFCENAFAQAEDHWESYIAAYEKGAATTLVNMSLKEKAPVKDQVFLLITSITFTPCENGLPTPEMQETLEGMDDVLARQVSFLGKTTFTGTRTYNCERLNYFYVKDSMDVRLSVQTFFKDNFPAFKNTITIRDDPEWKTYLDTLYPNEIVREQLEVAKVLERLTKEGDKLKNERTIDYGFLFHDEKNRRAFAAQMKREGFRITTALKKEDGKKGTWPIAISKTSLLNPQTISGMILYLRKKAAEFGGEYKVWNTMPIKN